MRRRVRWSGAIAIFGLLVGSIPSFAQVPPEFHGAWNLNYGSKTKCTRNTEENSRINGRSIAGWENSCKVVKFEVQKTYEKPENVDYIKTGVVELSCGAADAVWKSKEVWHVQSAAGQKMLIMTRFERTEDKDDNDKAPFGPYKPSFHVSVNKECK